MNYNVLDTILTKCNKRIFNKVIKDMKYSIKTQMNSEKLHRYSVSTGPYRYSYCYTNGLRKVNAEYYVPAEEVGLRCNFTLKGTNNSFRISGHNLLDKDRICVVTYYYQKQRRIRMSVKPYEDALKEMRRSIMRVKVIYKN